MKLSNGCMIVALSVSTIIPAAACAGWVTRKIAENDTGFGMPSISEGRVAWSERVQDDFEIFIWEQGEVRQLTDNFVDDISPRVDGSRVVWLRPDTRVQNDYNDWYRIVVNGAVNEAPPSPYLLHDWTVNDGFVAWSSSSDSTLSRDTAISVYDGSGAIYELAVPDTSSNHNPRISEGRVVWSGFDETGNRAFLWDGDSVVRLPEGVGIGQVPDIGGPYVTGRFFRENGEYGVTRYDLRTGELLEVKWESGYVGNPAVSEQFLAWTAEMPDGTHQVFAWEGGAAKQLSKAIRAYHPWVTKEFVVWADQRDNGSLVVSAYDGTSVTQTPATSFPAIDGRQIAWADEQNGKVVLFLATYVPEPTTVGLSLLATLGFVGRPRK